MMSSTADNENPKNENPKEDSDAAPQLREPESAAIVYLNGEYVPADEARISPLDRGFLFADGVYEVLRFYSGAPFLVEDHLDRLAHSMAAVRLPTVAPGYAAGSKPADGAWMFAAWAELFDELIRRNGLNETDGLIYLQVTRGAAPRMHAFPDPPAPPTIYAFAQERSRPSPAERRTGISVITHPDQRWDRCDIKSVSLLPNVLAGQDAADAGAVEAILHRNGLVTEGSHSSVFAVRSGVVYTHPLSRAILAGVTRKLVLNLCTEQGIPTREIAVSTKELHDSEELFLTGTGSEIAAVGQVDGVAVSAGGASVAAGAGPITSRLQEAFDRTIERARLRAE